MVRRLKFSTEEGGELVHETVERDLGNVAEVADGVDTRSADDADRGEGKIIGVAVEEEGWVEDGAMGGFEDGCDQGEFWGEAAEN